MPLRRGFYIYDSAPGKAGLDDIVLRFDENSDVINRYLHGPGIDQVFSDENFLNEVLWGLADKQGTVRDWVEYDEVSDTTNVYNHVVFDSYGKIKSQSNAVHKITIAYTGRYRDPVTGEQLHGKRWYDPRAGTWKSQDPGGFRMGDVNLYRYVGNGPTNFTDPEGLRPRGRSRGSSRPTSIRYDPGSKHRYRQIPPKTFVSWPEYEMYEGELLRRGHRRRPTETEVRAFRAEMNLRALGAELGRQPAIDQCRRLGASESEINAILNRTYVTRPGSRRDPMLEDLQRLAQSAQQRRIEETARGIAEHLARDHPERFGRDIPRLQRDILNIFENPDCVWPGAAGETVIFHRNGRTLIFHLGRRQGTMIEDPNRTDYQRYTNDYPH